MIDLKVNEKEFLDQIKIPVDKIYTSHFLEEIGNTLLYFIIKEAKSDLQSQGNKPTPKGQKEGIPSDPKFFESFGFEIKGFSIEIYSTWPTIDQIVEGRNSFPLKWLTKPKVEKVSFGGKRTPIIRTAPDSRNPWIHPGFKEHNFIERGVKIAIPKIEKKLAFQVKRAWEGRSL